jgi:hypothetical protein
VQRDDLAPGIELVKLRNPHFLYKNHVLAAHFPVCFSMQKRPYLTYIDQ